MHLMSRVVLGPGAVTAMAVFVTAAPAQYASTADPPPTRVISVVAVGPGARAVGPGARPPC